MKNINESSGKYNILMKRYKSALSFLSSKKNIKNNKSAFFGVRRIKNLESFENQSWDKKDDFMDI